MRRKTEPGHGSETRPGRRRSRRREVALVSASPRIALGEVAVHVVLPQAERLAYPHRSKPPGIDEPVHGHVRDSKRIGHFAHREITVARDVFCQWNHPSPPEATVRQCGQCWKGVRGLSRQARYVALAGSVGDPASVVSDPGPIEISGAQLPGSCCSRRDRVGEGPRHLSLAEHPQTRLGSPSWGGDPPP